MVAEVDAVEEEDVSWTRVPAKTIGTFGENGVVDRLPALPFLRALILAARIADLRCAASLEAERATIADESLDSGGVSALF